MIWFKNALIYRLSRDVDLLPEKLEQMAADFPFKPVERSDFQSFGWTTALGRFGSMFTHVAGNGAILMAAKLEEKMLPAAVVKEATDQKVSRLEIQNGRPLKKSEKGEVKAEVTLDLLARAFTRHSVTQLLIMPKQGLIVVDAGSYKKAENILALLRKTIGSLPVVPISPEKPLELALTAMVRNDDTPTGFTLGEEYVLKSVLEDGGEVKCKHQDYTSDEVKALIDADKLVVKMAMNWSGRIDFVLDDSFSIKRLKFSDVLQDQNNDIDREDMAQRLDADLALMTGEFEALTAELFRVFPLVPLESKKTEE